MVQDRDGLVNTIVHGALFRYVQYHMGIKQLQYALSNTFCEWLSLLQFFWLYKPFYVLYHCFFD